MYISDLLGRKKNSIVTDLDGLYLYATKLHAGRTPDGFWKHKKSPFLFDSIHIMTKEEIRSLANRNQLNHTDIVIFELTKAGYAECDPIVFIDYGLLVSGDQRHSWGRFGSNIMLHKMTHYVRDSADITSAYQFFFPTNDQVTAKEEEFRELNEQSIGMTPSIVHKSFCGHILNGKLTIV